MNKNKETVANGTECKETLLNSTDCKEVLLSNLAKIHTTELGKERIRKNLNITTDDVVMFCVNKIKEHNCVITRKGKNWYAEIDHCIITVNAFSYSIITAHKS